ncbi:MAG: hypothetical protein GC161_02035 [Planctomycetaceae bacterium]|nr:hypothetical protein [Planctomycetaceae bacterium]
MALPRFSLALAAATLWALGSSASAQTTHTVQLFTVSFSPSVLTIDEGDTVVWSWVTGFHDVKSGVSGVADGIWNSGSPVPAPNTFQITFDAAFLAANPVPGNTYSYYCSIHLPVMTGQIIVNPAGTPSNVAPYGSGVNPAGSLSLLSGDPKVGQAFSLGVRNTATTTAPAGFAYLLVATVPDPSFPNGTVLPNLGLSGPGAAGEVLVSFLPPNPILIQGPVGWGGGVNAAAPFNLALPNLPALVGAKLYFQGALLTPSQAFVLGLTNGLEVTVGS